MKLSKRTNMIILWIISIALVLGMIVMFTPTIGNPFAGGPRERGDVALLVNGVTITDRHVSQERQQTGLVGAGLPGQVGEDVDLVVLDSIIDREVLRQASARTRVSGAEVREAVNEFREAQGVAGRANEQAYLNLLRQHGFNDQSFRQHIESQLRQERYLDNVIGSVEITDEEVRTFFEAHQDRYQTDARIRARQIVVDDELLAEELRTRALGGEDFGELAERYSEERADRQGALGAPEGSTDPQPVSRTALPTDVAGPAFELRGVGITEVVPSGGRYYIVAVEEYLPAGTRPFDEVEDRVREDALQAKRQGEVERVLEELRAEATIEAPDHSQYEFNDEVVAVVGDRQIRRSELARATYLNPQIQQFLGPETATLISDFFIPTLLEQLIEVELAYQGAAQLEANFVGTRDEVAQAALNYVSRDAEVTEEEIEAYYETNIARFTVPARATVTQAEFMSADAAMEFREMLLAAEAVDDEAIAAAAEEAGGELERLGAVSPGQLEPELDTPLFASNAFEPLASDAGEEISDVLVIREEVAEDNEDAAPEDAEEVQDPNGEPQDENGAPLNEEDDAGAEEAEQVVGEDDGAAEAAEGEGRAEDEDDGELRNEDAEPVGDDEADSADGEADAAAEATPEMIERYVVLVAIRTEEFVRPLEEVRAQVEGAVLSTQRQQLRDSWLDQLREQIAVENRLDVADAAPQLDVEALPDDAVQEAEMFEEAPEGEAPAIEEIEETPAIEVDVEEDESELEETEP